MIKFEEHDGKLFRILEEPVPLTPDAKFPCVVRLIQDDSPMGRYNKSYSEYRYGVKLGCCLLPIIATHIGKNVIVNDIEWDINRYEIIGYPVVEGSAEWGEYQTQQGVVVRHKDGCVVRPEYDSSSRAAIFEHYPTGWQLYEPKPESENIIHGHIPPDMRLKYIDLGIYKVGDWVEWCGDQYMIESAPPQSGGHYDIRSPYDELGCSVYPENITRKLSPSEVVIPVNISGTVRQAYNEDGTINDEQFQLLPNGSWDGTEMFISFDALDTQTRELVESLLKAQEEK